MFKNYLKVAYRYLLRYKSYTIINITGLAVGVVCCILIMLFVRSEFSYDRFHTKADRIYRLWQHEKYQGEDFINTVTPVPMGPAVKANFPEVDQMCRVYAFNTLVTSGSNAFNEGIVMVDESLFKMFDFKLLKGNADNPFPNANAVILTPAMAQKYFGNDDAVGNRIEIQLGDGKQAMTVVGIAEKAPNESSIKYEFLIPYNNDQLLFSKRMQQSWFNVITETYVLLKPNINPAALEKKFPSMLQTQLGKNYVPGNFEIHLQPISDIHLNKDLPDGNLPVSNPKYAYILSTIGILILLVASINFITLSIGRSTKRAMEVGVRKAMGAARQQLIRQFWGEAFLVIVAAVSLGLLMAFFLLKPFNLLINRQLSFHVDAMFLAFCLGLMLVISLLAGIYPAIILSRYNPVEVLKGKLTLKNNAGLFRKGLIVGQFVTSIVMIICTIVIGRQIIYLASKDLGYNKEQVIIIPTNKNRKEGFQLAKLYKNELLKNRGVLGVTASTFSLAESPWATLGYNEHDKFRSFAYNEIDVDFIDAMQIELLQGRNFTKENVADSNNSILVNEAFLRAYNLDDPIGKKFGKYSQQIVGVVKDFNYESLHSKIAPLVLSMNFDTMARQSSDIMLANSPRPRVSVRLKAGDLQQHIALLKNTWASIAPAQEFEYSFLDERLAAAYEEEQKSAAIVKIAAGLSVFIACMGLLGLATLMVTQRTKEIGIRKVLGAGTRQLVQLLSKDFVLLIAIAAVIAFPIAWLAMSTWLSDFEYRTAISWWIFLLSAIAAIAIAFITISTQAIKAALANPVKSLRTE